MHFPFYADMTHNFPHLYPHDIPIKCWVFHFFQVISSLHRSGLQLRLLATPQPVRGLPWATLRLRGKPRKMMYKWWGFHIYVSLLSGNPCLGPKKMMQNKSWTHVLTVSPFFSEMETLFCFFRDWEKQGHMEPTIYANALWWNSQWSDRCFNPSSKTPLKLNWGSARLGVWKRAHLWQHQ